MTCASVTIRLGRWMHVKLIRQSVTYVSGTFVTLDTGLNTPSRQGGYHKDQPRNDSWARKRRVRYGCAW